MRTRIRLGVASACLSCMLVLSADTHAQTPAVGPPTGSMVVNPYANPYINPFMNPYMTGGTMDRNTTLMYLWAANQQAGGLGSGRLSTSRPVPSATQPPRGSRGRAVAEMPVSLLRPGGAAGRYFNRGTGSNDAQRASFGRQNRYFANNGR